MGYHHGIKVVESATRVPAGEQSIYGVQVAIGTAPVHMAKDPHGVSNIPILIRNMEEAKETLGYSEDWDTYTLCQCMEASFEKFGARPVVFINVLDPNRHVKENEEKSYGVKDHQVRLEEGILFDTVVAKEDVGENERTYELGKDYILSRDESGGAILTLLPESTAYTEATIKVSGKMVDPSAVTEEDIIGAYDTETGKETGMELIRQIYPRFQFAPGLLLAPGWSHLPNVAAAMQAKCEEINGVFSCECLLDLDTETAKLYTDCRPEKEKAGFTSPHAIVLWPKLVSGGKAYAFSALFGAMASSVTLENEDVPYMSLSSRSLKADGAVLKDGTEILLDQVQAGEINGDGIVTAINENGWKSYGNNTACYPENQDPKDRWIQSRRMFSFVRAYLALNFKPQLVDQNAYQRTLNDFENKFNTWGRSLVSRGMCAGLRMEFDKDVSLEDLLNGHFRAQIYFAPFPPAEYVEATMEFDVEALENALWTEAE